jgi:class 3 adenylate cyclase/pimeloyl-ACP methyl ester carboxylesterase
MPAMEPQFRFCTSADGTRIAYATFGSGPPLLYANTHALSMDAQFQVPEAREYFEALAARVGIVMFDRRGTGASAREVDDLSPEAEAGDVAAVADAAGLRDFTLFADIATAVCATYVCRSDSRARKLVLWIPIAELMVSEDSARRMLDDWSLWRRLWASSLFPDGPVSIQKAMSKAMRDTATVDMMARRMSGPRPDYGTLLPRVSLPTLILQRERERGRAASRSNDREVRARQENTRFTAMLPNGQLRFVKGYPPTPYPDHEQIVDAVFEFMGLTDPAASEARLPSGTSVILFTDIADSVALTERMGDAAFRAASGALEDRVRGAIHDAGGTPVDGRVLGDGVMGVFTSAAQAIGAARACADAAQAAELPLHIGLHAGDVISEGTNVYGGAVNIASRICALCAPGEILVSQTVRDLARTSAGVTFEDRGEHALKGIEDPVRLFAVRRSVG